jgi:Family of unknown function (DUF6922)
MIPNELRPFFWEVNAESFDPLAFPHYTIWRILELGTDTAVAWMKQAFNEQEIKQVIRKERRLSPRSANYWALIYSIPREEVAALASHPAPL